MSDESPHVQPPGRETTPADEPGAVTALLVQLGSGDDAAWEPLMELVYRELRRLAHARLRHERGATIGTTGLVHEAWLRLAGIESLDWQNRGHFFAVAASAMRRLLIDRARAARRLKRGGAARPAPLTDAGAGSLVASIDGSADELIALDEALTRLGALSKRQRKVVELRFFAGLTVTETADVLRVGVNTVKRDWSAARAWLNRELTR